MRVEGGEIQLGRQFLRGPDHGPDLAAVSVRRPRVSEQILALFGDHAAEVRAMARTNERFRRGLAASLRSGASSTFSPR